MAKKLQLVEDFLRRVWVEDDLNALDELFTDHTCIRGLEETPLTGADQFRSYHRMLSAQLAEVQFETLTAVEQGAWVALELKLSGIHAQSQVPFDTRAMMMVQVVDGKIVSGSNLIDLIRVFEAVGRLPERTLDLCLLGARLEVGPAG